jgi:hypothetical protein
LGQSAVLTAVFQRAQAGTGRCGCPPSQASTDGWECSGATDSRAGCRRADGPPRATVGATDPGCGRWRSRGCGAGRGPDDGDRLHRPAAIRATEPAAAARRVAGRPTRPA